MIVPLAFWVDTQLFFLPFHCCLQMFHNICSKWNPTASVHFSHILITKLNAAFNWLWFCLRFGRLRLFAAKVVIPDFPLFVYRLWNSLTQKLQGCKIWKLLRLRHRAFCDFKFIIIYNSSCPSILKIFSKPRSYLPSKMCWRIVHFIPAVQT